MTAKPALNLIRPLVPAARASSSGLWWPHLPTTYLHPTIDELFTFFDNKLTFAILVCSSHEPFDISAPLPPSLPHHHHHHLQLLLLLLLLLTS